METERGVILEEIGMYADDPAGPGQRKAARRRLSRQPPGPAHPGKKKATLNKMTGAWPQADYKGVTTPPTEWWSPWRAA